MDELEIKLPDEVMNGMPGSKEEIISYLSTFFDSVIEKYSQRFQKRVPGVMGHALSRYERSLLKDLLLDLSLGKVQENK